MSAVAYAWEPISIDGYKPKTAYETIISNVRIVSPGYFGAMGIPLVRGRYFDERDIRGQQETAIVDEAFAQRFWPDDDPLGKRVQRGKDGPWRTVVGVINDRKQYSAEKEPPIAVYYPSGQVIARNMYLVVRTQDDPLQHAGAVTKVIQSFDPELPVFDIKAMEGRLYGSLAGRRFAMTLLGVLAVIALGLAAIGVYGVISYSVTQRTHEIGIRMALGAKPVSIVKLVLGRAMALVGIGIGMGLAGAIALTRLISSLLYGISSTDIVTFIMTSFFLAGVAALASYLPARRASRVDPMVALRYE
jgi:putative ABC transport system permease protein